MGIYAFSRASSVHYSYDVAHAAGRRDPMTPFIMYRDVITPEAVSTSPVDTGLGQRCYSWTSFPRVGSVYSSFISVLGSALSCLKGDLEYVQRLQLEDELASGPLPFSPFVVDGFVLDARFSSTNR